MTPGGLRRSSPIQGTGRPSTRQRGFALIVVVWTLGLLALLIASIVASGRSDVRIAAGLQAGAVAEAAADGAIPHAGFQVWRGTWTADGTPHRVAIGQATVDITIEDQGGRIDPNFASPPLLAALLSFAGVDPAQAPILARRIVDWRSPMPFSLEGGLKLQHYREAGLVYGPPSRPFPSVAELGQVQGMTEAILGRLRPYVAVHQAADPHAADGGTANQMATSLVGVMPADVMSAGIGTTDRVLQIKAVAHLAGNTRFVRTALVRVAGQDVAGRQPWQVVAWQ